MSPRPAFHGDHPVTVTLPAREWDVVLSAIETEGIKTAKCIAAPFTPADKSGLMAWDAALGRIIESVEAAIRGNGGSHE